MSITALENNPRVWIPEISDEVLNHLSKRIRPVVRKHGKPCYLSTVEPRQHPFTLSGYPAGDADNIQTLRDIVTYHVGQNSFVPSVAEIIVAIPEDLIGEVVAFEVVGQPYSHEARREHRAAINAGYLVAIVRLYRKA